MLMTSLLTNVISFSSVCINKTGRVGQQKLKVVYLKMVLVMPGDIRKLEMKWNSQKALYNESVTYIGRSGS